MRHRLCWRRRLLALLQERRGCRRRAWAASERFRRREDKVWEVRALAARQGLDDEAVALFRAAAPVEPYAVVAALALPFAIEAMRFLFAAAARLSAFVQFIHEYVPDLDNEVSSRLEGLEVPFHFARFARPTLRSEVLATIHDSRQCRGELTSIPSDSVSSAPAHPLSWAVAFFVYSSSHHGPPATTA